MAVPSLAERISQSFVAWELRGRGWHQAPYPVWLEPPYRPLLLLRGEEPMLRHVDDGKRPTFLSSLVEKASVALAGNRGAISEKPEPYEEQAPFPAQSFDERRARRILLPPGLSINSAAQAQLLMVLGGGHHPIAFELVGRAGVVSLHLSCSDLDEEHVFSAFADHIPEAAAVEGDGEYDDEADESTSFIVDFGYANEFFLPIHGLRAFRLDPYVPLVSALARARPSETLCFQVLFERARNPWREAILSAVVSPDGGPLISDAPEFIPAAKEKTASPLFACSMRLGAWAASTERARDLARGTRAFFEQFERPGGNSFIPLSNDEYHDEVHARAFVEHQSFRTGMLLSLDELQALVHLPDASVRNEAFARVAERTKALPEVARDHDLVIGDNTHRGLTTPATIAAGDRLQHTMIAGASGTGKSTLLVSMIAQDIAQGAGVAVLDPHGDLIDDVLRAIPASRTDDVVLFDPADSEYPVGFNVLSAESELERTLLASDLVAIFQRFATSWGDSMSTVLSNAILAVLQHPAGGTLLHLRRFLIEESYRKHFLSGITDHEVLFFWEKEWPLIGSRSIGPILTRLNTFLRPTLIRHILGQQAPALRFASVLSDRRIFLGRLSQGLIGTENAYVLGSLLLGKFLQTALARQQLAQTARTPFWLYLDEAEHFVTPSLASLLTQARKYGVGLTMAFQMLSQLRSSPQVESAVLSNTQTRIVFRVSDDDARKLGEGFSFFESADLRNLGRAEAIVRIGEARNDFNLRTRPAPKSTADGEGLRIAHRDRSRAQWARPFDSLRAEVEATYGLIESRSPLSAPAIEAAPTEAKQASTPSPNATAASPAPRAKKSSASVEPEQLGRGGREHKYLQHLIKRLGEERGFRSIVEDAVPGGRVDVSLRRGHLSIACEVSITTDAKQELENLKKCAKAGFSRVWLILSDRKRRDVLAGAIGALGLGDAAACLVVDDLVPTLDAIAPPSTTTTKTAGGYKVKVTRRVVSYEDLQQRTSAVADVITKSLLKSRKEK